jgi:hypothetical protein
MFYSAYPNIFQFTDVLKNVQKDTYIKQRSIHVIKNRRMIVCENVQTDLYEDRKSGTVRDAFFKCTVFRTSPSSIVSHSI